MAKLNANTIVVHPRTGVPTVLEKDSDVPGWAADLVGDHLTEAVAGDGPPPHSGSGSGKAAWAEYAADHNVEVPEDATRDEIIAACQEAGVPVD